MAIKKKGFHKNNKPKDNYIPDAPLELLNKPVADLPLSSYTQRSLAAAKIITLLDLLKKTEREMFKIQNFGKRNLDDVKRTLIPLGLTFKPQIDITEIIKVPLNTFPQTNEPINAPLKQIFNNAPIKQPISNVAPQKIKKSTIPGTPAEWIKFNKNGKWGFKDLMGGEPIPANYDEVFLFKEDFACFEKIGSFGYINSKNEVVIKPQFECAMSFSEGLASVTIDGKCGYINKDGKLIIPYLYDAATAFISGKARVKADGKWGNIDTAGEVIWDK